MKSKFIVLSVLTSCIFLLASCDKNKRITKNLAKGSGIWNIEYYLESGNNNSNTTAYLNCGIFTFDDEGWGNSVLEIDGNTYLQTFSYSVEGNFLNLYIGLETFSYSLKWEKDVVELYRAGQKFKLTKKE